MNRLKLFVFFCLVLAACGGKAVIDGEDGGAGGSSSTTSTHTTSSTTSTSFDVMLQVTPPTTPGSTIVQDAELVHMGYFQFMPIGGDVFLHSLTLKHVGVGDPDDIIAVRLTGDAFPLSASPVKTFDPVTMTVTYDVNLLIPLGYVTNLSAVCDFDAPAPGGQHAVEIESAADVVATGGEVVGVFPEVGGTFTVSSTPDTTYCDPWDSPEQFGYGGCCGTFPQIQDPSALNPGMLVKGSLELVYYLGSDGQRYIFPSTVILDSWYGPYDADGIPISDGSPCSAVIEVPDEILAAIPLGSNVTFRPGVFITGLTTNPNRWVVSQGRTLHKLVPTSLQEQIYPGTWSDRTRMTMDAFFGDYYAGVDITDAADYDPAAEVDTNIEQELGLAP